MTSTNVTMTSVAAGIHVGTREIFRQWALEDRFADPSRLLEVVPMHDARDEARTLRNAPLRTVVRIGPGGYREEGDLLRRFMGEAQGLALVRPDLHVAGVFPDEALARAVDTHLGGLVA